MFTIIKKFLNLGQGLPYKSLVKNGALIIDVRTKSEYQQGHIKNAINIPINNLSNHYSKLAKDKPIITCCQSGSRSEQAKIILKSNGYHEVYNGGSWSRLQKKINS